MTLSIIKYNKEYIHIWDKFVEEELFGTIYHTRNFISYHPENRFQDESIIIYLDDVIACVLPCCKKGDKYFSYTGATYGGPVISRNYAKVKYMKLIIDKIFDYYENKIEFRLANDIYFNESCHSLYFLLSQKTKIYPELSWYIKSSDDFIEKIVNKRNKKNLKKSLTDLEITCDYEKEEYKEENYIKFYDILKKNLNTNHQSDPTHSLEEFLKVKNLLKEKQRLYLVKNKENILGGVFVIKVTQQCWYTFYISRNIDLDKTNMSVMYLMYKISQDAKKENVTYVDYGISTEDRGKLINEGLTDYKESSLGGISNYRYLFLFD